MVWDCLGGMGVVFIAVINGEVRLRQIQFEQVRGAGQVQSAGLRQGASALLQDVGDVFATVSLVVVSVLESADEPLSAVDFEQGQDFLDVMPGVKAALLELFVVIRRLGGKSKEAVEQVLIARLETLLQKRPGVVGQLEVAMPLVTARMLCHGLVLMIEGAFVRMDF